MKKILLVNGSYNEIPLIKAAQRLGYFVITSGNDPSGSGHKYANKYVPGDYSDKNAILEIAGRERVEAICSCGNDFGALSAAYACEALGLPGHDTYANSRLFHEKDQFKQLAAELSLNSPTAVSFTALEAAKEHVRNLCFPQIIKPVDMGGGKGVSVVYTRESAEAAINTAFRLSKVKRIVIEDYIIGKQQGITVFLHNGKVVFDYSTNDFSYLNPFMVWIAYGSPAEGYAGYRDSVIRDIETIASSKQIADGFLTIQYILKGSTPYYLETMRRCLGNCHYKCMSEDTGVDFYEWFIASEAGLDCTEYYSRVRKKPQKSGFFGVYASQDGTVDDLVLDSKFQSMVFDSVMLNGPGYQVKDYLHDKLGMWFYTLKSDEDEAWFQNHMKSAVTVHMK